MSMCVAPQVSPLESGCSGELHRDGRLSAVTPTSPTVSAPHVRLPPYPAGHRHSYDAACVPFPGASRHAPPFRQGELSQAAACR